MLGGIVERSTGAPSSPAPARAAESSTAGFPTILHHSQKTKRPSAFAAAAAARQQRSAAISAGTAVEASEIPTSAAPAPTQLPFLANEAGPSKPTEHPGKLDEYARMQRDVGEENRQRVAAMTQEERDLEIAELEERFGRRALQALRMRAEKRKQSSGTQGETPLVDAPVDPARHTGGPEPPVTVVTAPDDTTLQPLDAPTNSAPPDRPKSVRFVSATAASPTVSVNTSEDPAKPADPAPAFISPTSSLRFDLSGDLLSSAQQADLATHLGLHHHGDQPHLAGYTIAEVLWLCRSTVPAQRIGMMGLLARIIRVHVLETDSDGTAESVRSICATENVCGKAVNLAVDVLQTSRNMTLLQTSVDLLFTALGGPTWAFFRHWHGTNSDGHGIGPFDSTADADGRAAPITSILFEALLPRLAELISKPDLLDLASTQQLILILRRASYAGRETPETVLALIPPLLQRLVIRRPWPPSESSTSNTPSVEPLRLMLNVIASSRSCASELVNAVLPGSLLRFCVVSTWPDESELGIELCIEVLRIHRCLARYGLGAGTARSAHEIWVALGIYIRDNNQKIAPTPHISVLTAAYYALLESWITCSIDPHRTTPEHDLTWTQITGLGWADEAMATIDALSAVEGSVAQQSLVDVAASCLNVLIAWLKGASVNDVRAGEEEKRRISAWLGRPALQDLLHRPERGQVSAGTHPRVRLALLQLDRLVGRHILGIENAVSSVDTKQADLLRDEGGLDISSAKNALDRNIQYETLCAKIRTGTGMPAERALIEGLRLLTAFQPGEEPIALALLDDMLKLDLGTLSTDIASSVAGIGHPDSLVLLRPLLQHAILPDVSDITAPWPIEHLYLKATGSLRRPGAGRRQTDGNGKMPPGLPLRPDWLFHPIDELLHSADSTALQQAPPDWDPSEVQILRATLVLIRAALVAGLHPHLSASELIFGLMKVYMLEHQTGGMVNTGESELFRDDVVADCLQAITHTLTEASLARNTTGAHVRSLKESSDSNDERRRTPTDIPASRRPADLSETHRPGLEAAAIPFLGLEPFYQFYADLVSLFENVSFGDPTFAQLIIVPLSMTYTPDYRKLVWSNPNALRLLRTERSNVPLEVTEPASVTQEGSSKRRAGHGWRAGLEAFFRPAEDDPEVLNAYAQAILRQWISPERQPFMWEIATNHLSHFLSQADDIDDGVGGLNAAGQQDAHAKSHAMNRLRKGVRAALSQSHSDSVRVVFGGLLEDEDT